MKTLILTCLLCVTGLMARGQDFNFAPVGAEWEYTYYEHQMGPMVANYVSVKDTIVNTRACRKVQRSGQSDFLILNVDPDTKRVYHYIPQLDEFGLYADFSLEVGDTLKRQEYSLDCMMETKMLKIDAIIEQNIFGKDYKFFQFSDEFVHVSDCERSGLDDQSIFRLACPIYSYVGMSELYGFVGFITPMYNPEGTYGLIRYSFLDEDFVIPCSTVQRKPVGYSTAKVLYNRDELIIQSLDYSNKLEIRSAVGSLLYSDRFYDSKKILDLDFLPNGVYIVTVNNSQTKILVTK
ncbi:MAG: hypothetical protein KF690_06540 [Bacteroidetes bacterium]|nr:hypothetical protein [Bacteroidota bacterium]